MNSGKLQMEVSEEEVKERLSVARRFLESIDPDKLGKCPDTICLNCGRSVLVGKCCDNPNIVVMEKEQVSPKHGIRSRKSLKTLQRQLRNYVN